MKAGTAKFIIAFVSFIIIFAFNQLMQNFENNEKTIISKELTQIGEELQDYIRVVDSEEELPSNFFNEVLLDQTKYYVLKEYSGQIDFIYSREKKIKDFHAKDKIFSIEGIALCFDGSLQVLY
ncbi:MAG: hypothetical protein NE328_23220 [Lentisphaeraceae bacterium]|nr:hypothetical protein [Lentisphaeraceae bacterium]